MSSRMSIPEIESRRGDGMTNAERAEPGRSGSRRTSDLESIWWAMGGIRDAPISSEEKRDRLRLLSCLLRHGNDWTEGSSERSL